MRSGDLTPFVRGPRIQCFGHVMRRMDSENIKKGRSPIEKRPRRRPEKQWLNGVTGKS